MKVPRNDSSTQRLSLNASGKVVLELRVPFRDGTTHFVFEPLAFIERLAALVPPPRMHQLTYHGRIRGPECFASRRQAWSRPRSLPRPRLERLIQGLATSAPA